MTKTDKPKTAALDVNVPVVRSEKLPITPKLGKFRDFDCFVKTVEEVREWVEQCDDAFHGKNENYYTAASIDGDWNYIESLIVDAKAGFAKFDRDELYDIEDHEEFGRFRTVKPDHVAKRLGVMLSAFPAANPGTPKGYARMLVEHVGAIEKLTAVALESACREIERTKKFAPAISEVFEVLTAHVKQWTERRHAMFDAEDSKNRAVRNLTHREQKKAKEEHDAALAKAINEARVAVGITQRLVKDIEEAKAKLATDIETANAKIANLERQHAEWEQRVSERQRKVIELTPPEADDHEKGVQTMHTPAARKGNGHDANP